MANHKSALKRMRQNVKKAQRNVSNRTLLKTAIKKVLALVESEDKKEAEVELKLATRTISKIASKGAIHKRTAARKIGNLSRKVHQLSATV